MPRFINKKVVTIGLALGLSLGAAGAAFAYFTSTGTGTGSAQTGSATNWTVTAAAGTGGPIYPGQGTETIAFTVKNAGSGNQSFSAATASVKASGGNVTVAGVAVPGCLATWYTATAGAPTPAFNTSIVPNGTAAVNVTVTMTDAAVSQNVCQGVNPDIQLAVS